MTKGCYTCRRRRIVCDNGFPTCRKCRNAGKECLGYQKPLVWVKGGVASRGKMMGLSFDDVSGPSQSSGNSFVMSSGAGMHSQSMLPFDSVNGDVDSAMDQHHGALEHSPHYQTETPMYSLVDPLFQDVNKTSRFYINIFNHLSVRCLALYDEVRNPYRELIPYINGSPVLADSLAAIGALQFIYKSEDYGRSLINAAAGDESSLRAGMSLMKPRDRKVYEHFLRLKQRALHQLSTEVSHSTTRIDDRTVAAMFVLILLDVIESGNTSWMYHLEGAKNILKSRFSDFNRIPTTDGIYSFVIDSCLITEIMGSTLARPGVLSRPFFSPSMGSAVLKRLEKTAFVGCPAYLLDVIFFVHAQRYSESDEKTAEYSLSFLSPSGEATRAESPLAVLRHIDSFDDREWAEEMQSYLTLPDLSARLALARAYKAAVHLYARRVLSKTNAFASDCALTTTTTTDTILRSRRTVETELIQNLLSIPPEDEHFKCLIWPTFIAGAESSSREQRAITLRLLGFLWNGVYSLNLQNAACVLKVMWDKQDERRQATADRLPDEEEEEDDEGFDWIQELDQSSTDWLFI
ncbi:C6 finger domain protein Acr-2, putative [Talaromyces stipitatus ATCC 10500]|uniref:C6 finger domain protein Acr-2, putative n=1 Tax=Talaromyces stipitatus (strain ATCC 10500 / CBS 375.48 / QM 6759 / NRRL 1006) TaxID=441959 RepID=B8M5H8_TALSN|nr:C6 finger domain protein Acr-2, putative [Talaromyces stipitatus ATCC 10500]EED19872.1 C6 finger domain protein Acr-2, putative [Talaromyces stipitatus ATCC 10500]